MQTFLPYPDFTKSARCLDRQRLGKQRVEVLQILNVLAGKTSSWSNHPAVRMWRGHSGCLAEYGRVICREWRERGYADTCGDKIKLIAPLAGPLTTVPPDWLGNRALHRSHKSNLLRKDPIWYAQFRWSVPDDLEYVWPT